MKIHYFYKRNYSQGFYDLEIVAWLEEKENIKVYTLPGGSHRTRIGSFDKKTQEEIMTLINRWLKE